MAETAAATGEVSLVYPLAILAAPLIELAGEHFLNKPKPDDLAELYRDSLLRALEACAKDHKGLAEPDRDLVELWKQGLGIKVKGDPFWAAILEDSIPTQMLSINLRDASSSWPLLRAQLDQWTNWFRYRSTGKALPLGAAIPRQPLKLSRDFEQYLAANLPRELLQRFQLDLVSGEHRDAFNTALLRKLDSLDRALRPLDPLRHFSEFHKPEDANTVLKLLDTEYRAIPYLGRRADLDSLWRWLESDAPVSFQVVVGRGGKGKTRLAYQFLEELEDKQPFTWHAGLLPHERFEDELKNAAFRRWHARKPTLIVIDYADAASEQLQKSIIPELARTRLTKDDPPLRFLLLARTADATQGWYKTLRSTAGSSEQDFFPSAPLELSDLDREERRTLVNAMLSAAARVERTIPLTLPAAGVDALIDKRLDSDEFADPLVLSMAAIVANGNQSLASLHLHRTDLARETATRERRRLQRLERDGEATLLLHMAAYVSLVGGMTYSELETAAETEAQDLRTSASIPHVAAILAPQGVADPIRIDIIAEAFIHEVLHERAQHGSETILRAAQRKPGQVVRTLVRTVQDFAPDPSHPAPEDEPCQTWALERLTQVLRHHRSAITDGVFWEIHAALPIDTTIMIHAARDFYQAIASARSLSADYVGLAALVSYANYESKSGNRAQALSAIQEAVLHYRELAAQNPDAFLPDLAMALNNQAAFQSEMGQRAEALASIQEAVLHYRELAAQNPDFLPNLAAALNNQANRQSEMGQRAEALASIQEAVLHYRQLAAQNPDAFLPDLAMALNNQAAFQSEMGQRAEALASIQEAVLHYRELAAQNPDAFLPNLATALNNQANLQSEMGQRAEALQSIQEAVLHYRQLAAQNPDAFLPNLATALNNQATLQSEMGQRAEALASIQEAVLHYRELAAQNPDAFLPNLAAALNNQANLQSAMGQRAEALASIQEAVRYRRELAAQNPDAFLPNLATALNNQANLQSEMGQRAEALQSIQEAVLHYRELAAKNRDAFLPDLAMALNNQATLQSEMGQRAEALASIQQAVRYRRELAAQNPDAFLPNLAGALNNQATLQSEMGQRAEALASIQQAVLHYRELAAQNPDAFLPNLAMSMGAWGGVLLAADDSAGAAAKFAEGVLLITPLAQKLPEAHLRLAVNLANEYSRAREAAGIEPDPDCLWPLEALKQLKERPDADAQSATP